MNARAGWLCRGLLATCIAHGLPFAAHAQEHAHMPPGMPMQEMPAEPAPAATPSPHRHGGAATGAKGGHGTHATQPVQATHATHATHTTPPTGIGAMDMPKMDMPGMDMSGMDMSGMDMSGMDMSGMDMPAADVPADGTTASPSAGPMPGGQGHATGSSAALKPVTPIPPLTDADRAAAQPAMRGHGAHDSAIHNYTLFDRLEAWNGHGGTGLRWQGRAWIGTDLDRVWLRSEGERVDGHTEGADLELLYGHSVATWWDVVAGVRHQFGPGPSQDSAAIGVIGTAPYKLEVQATAYLAPAGRTSARVEVEYQALVTNRLVLQPLVEVELSGNDDPRRGVGSGLSTAEAGVRLRYEITRRFAPYIGIVRARAFGNTASLRRAQGDDVDDTRLVLGVRTWF